MVVAEAMNKPTLKVSMSDSDSSSNEESEESEQEMEVQSEEPQDAEADVESSSSDDEESESEGGALMTNEGWADAVAKVLGSTKPKNKKTLVLSRAKKHSEIVKKEKEEKPEFEVIGESKEDVKPVKKEEPGSGEPAVKKKKVEKEKSKIRLKPNILEKDRERILNKIATKGVVQLFNAVRNQQKTLEKEMSEDLTETKKEKILKKFDKRTFLDSLMGNTKSVIVDEAKKLKSETKTEDDAPKWSALRDDFMMGAKMKDWDKESVDE
ncbi:rrp15p domain-containing protein [Phthorimaea operculella]|nr:rrp15p domain-containing protein [Phthorimaea operculella]